MPNQDVAVLTAARDAAAIRRKGGVHVERSFLGRLRYMATKHGQRRLGWSTPACVAVRLAECIAEWVAPEAELKVFGEALGAMPPHVDEHVATAGAAGTPHPHTGER